jgi:hypothetical protein
MKPTRDELIDRIAEASRRNRELLAHKSSGPEADAKQAQIFAVAIVRHLEVQAPADLDRADLIKKIAHASNRNRKLVVRKVADPAVDATHMKMFASAIVRHLEQSGALLSK